MNKTIYYFLIGLLLSGKTTRRIPITSKPQLKSEPISRDSVTEHVEDIQSKITSKFLSSSIASTNIMDTSDLPVTMETTTTTTIGKVHFLMKALCKTNRPTKDRP